MNFLIASVSSEPSIDHAPFILSGVLLSLVVIYLASKIGGEISNRLGLPPVLGELLAGVIVGVSALKLLTFPESGSDGSDSVIMWLLQTTLGLPASEVSAVFTQVSDVVLLLSELGVIILLFEIGLESDLKQLLGVGAQAVVVAVIGVVLPFAAGTAGLIFLFGMAPIPAIFAGAALTATSIGITSRVLSELGKLTSKEGQIILGAAVTDDVLGIIVLAIVASLAKTGTVDLGNVIILIISAASFLVGALLLGQLVNKLYVSVATNLKTRGEIITPAFIFAFAMAYLGNAIHLEAILGSFTAGLILDESDERNELQKQVVPVADLLVPIFFVTVGAKTNIGVLNPLIPVNREGLIIAAFLIVVAIVGKVATGLGAFGQPGINRWAIGVGMIPRGEVGLVFAGIGSSSGVLSESLNAAIVIMVIITTFIAPPLLRVAFGISPDLESKELKTEVTKES
ncbi:Kef-type K+ transport system, membrane component [Synechococcus sp. PCC 7502]|uniref:cation:proton antiporter n=1 Tax=Synechococcus sp. PCC 7502 TaxID=1173263 RepID=UPI00029FB449|nr:cation:proton antiporter [Synechococcus sp. PCC 7502]AFY72773.1 Kef-type K+ transport system, membrane component [Synechococcus sp. PCC 7502]